MGKNFTYVDNSNVLIEGRRLAAVRNGIPGADSIEDAIANRAFDMSWNLDYGTLHQIVCGDPSEIGSAKLWGSPPPGDSFWAMVRRHGFKVTTYERSVSGKEKRVDAAIAYELSADAHKGLINKVTDEITLVSGDGDFVPVVQALVGEGFCVDVVFWGHASKDLVKVATRFISLDDKFEFLTVGPSGD